MGISIEVCKGLNEIATSAHEGPPRNDNLPDAVQKEVFRMLIHWIWLATRPGMSDRMKAAVIGCYPDAEDVFYTTEYDRVEALTDEALAALSDKNLHEADKILTQCIDKEIHILTYGDEGYPAKLRNISDPPMVLYYKGQLPDFDHSPMIGVVGTRKASSYGMNVAQRMGWQIAKCGGTVVSGAAFGIDGAAMNSALKAEGMVVGVLGCGPDVVYPPSNRGLFADMERRGCLISEFPPETPPMKWNFPKRNRIISGLSDGVLVVEAPERSGSLITARQASEQGRDVFVVPGNVDVLSCAGSNALLRDGAQMVTTGWDILSEYEGVYPDKVRRFDGTLHPAEVPELVPEIEKEPLKVAQKPRLLDKIKPPKTKIKKKEIDNGPRGPYIDGEKPLPPLAGEEQLIVDQLKAGPRLIDDVIGAIGFPAGKLLPLLTMMEVKGLIRRLPGNMLELK